MRAAPGPVGVTPLNGLLCPVHGLLPDMVVEKPDVHLGKVFTHLIIHGFILGTGNIFRTATLISDGSILFFLANL